MTTVATTPSDSKAYRMKRWALPRIDAPRKQHWDDDLMILMWEKHINVDKTMPWSSPSPSHHMSSPWLLCLPFPYIYIWWFIAYVVNIPVYTSNDSQL